MVDRKQLIDLSDQFFILVSFISSQQWGTSYSIRIFQAEDKLACILKFWEDGGIEWIEHEFDDSYNRKYDEVIRNLKKGIDQEIKLLEFDTDWDGYDSYSLEFLASGHIDTFLDEAFKGTLAYLQLIYDEVAEYIEEDGDPEGYGSFIDKNRQLLNGLMAEKAVSIENNLKKLKEIVEGINIWLAENINQSI